MTQAHLLTPVIIAIRQLQGEASLLEARLLAIATTMKNVAEDLNLDFEEVVRRSAPLTTTLDQKQSG